MNASLLAVTKTKKFQNRPENLLSPRSPLVNIVILFIIICGVIPFNPQGIILPSSQKSTLIYNDFNFDTQTMIPSSLVVPSSPHSSFDLSAVSFPGFTENRGQHPDQELYYYFMHDTYAIGFYESRIQVFTRLHLEDPWESVFLTLPGGLPCIPRGINLLDSTFNYFNHDPIITRVPQWAEILYESIYPGISLRFYCVANALKYDFIILPYMDPSIIQLEIEVPLPMDVEITPKRVVCISKTTPGLILWEDSSPIAFQTQYSNISVNFQQTGFTPLRYGISLEKYDTSQILVIDPLLLLFSTYLGGSELENNFKIAVDVVGCVYITGTTRSTDFPTINAYDATFDGNSSNLFVTKFAADGQSLIYSTYFGISGEEVSDITVDSVGCVFVIGTTYSTDFPTMNAFDATLNGEADVFVTKFAADGQSLIYSTYLGGSGIELGYDVSVDTVGCVYVIGTTDSSDFPLANAFDATLNGEADVFVTKFAVDGQSLLYSTFLGGSDVELGFRIAVDTAGCAYVAGLTFSSNFPTMNALDTALNGTSDIFVTKFAADGQSLIYSTYLERSGSEEFRGGIAVDAIGCLYIVGNTESSDFPTVNAFDATLNGRSDIFVTKFAANGQSLIYSTYLGGLGPEEGYDISVDSAGCVYVVGETGSPDFPTSNAYDSTVEGPDPWDGFITAFAPNGQTLLFSTYFGGSMYDIIEGIAIDATRCVYLTGFTTSPDFPLLNAYDSTYSEGFVAKLDPDTDGDGIPNYWEYIMGLNMTNPTDAGLDKDGDGLSNYWEYSMDLNATDPADALLDKDSDGMPNIWEFTMGLNATDPSDAVLDLDSDDLINLIEHQLGTNATNPDTDGDMMPDGWEYSMLLNPTNSSDALLDLDDDDVFNLLEYLLGTNATNPDTDGDMMPDGWEYQMDFNPIDPTDADLDFDNDGLSNLAEYRLGTNPKDRDTDNDGFRDGNDAAPFSFWFPTGFLLIMMTCAIITGAVYVLHQHRFLVSQSPLSMLAQVDQRIRNHNYAAAKDVLQRYLRLYRIKVFGVSPPPLVYKMLQIVSTFSEYYSTVTLIPRIPELAFTTHETLIDSHLEQIKTMTGSSNITQCIDPIQTHFNQLKEIRKDLIILAHELQEYRQIYTTLISASPSEDPTQFIAPLSALLTQLAAFSQKVHERVDVNLPQCELLRMITALRNEIEGTVQKFSPPALNSSLRS